MSDPLIDAANAISPSSPNIRKFSQMAAQRIVADEATEVSLGQALTDLAARVSALENPQPAPVPTGPTAWKWDATTATVDPNSATIAAFVSAAGASAYLSCDVAKAVADQTSPPYQIIKDSGRGSFDTSVYIPLGTQPGCSSDHHLVVLDPARGRETDFYQAKFDPLGWHAGGGTSQPLGAVQEPSTGSANAARLALSGGLVTPEDIAAGVIDHALVFSMPATQIGGPCVYPANQAQAGPAGVGHPVWGQWLRLSPNADLSACSGVSLMIAKALQKYGMFLRDGGSNLDIYGVDAINQGGNTSAYGGLLNLTTNTPTISNYPYATQLKGIPWTSLQVLLPPPAA